MTEKLKNIDLTLFEKVIAFKSMTNSTYLMTIADFVKPEYFEDTNISLYFEIIKDFYEKRQTLPTITEVKTYLTTDLHKKNFKKLVESFKELDSKINEEELYENTEKFLKERATWCALGDISENLEHKTKNPSEVLEEFEKITGISLHTNKGFELYADMDVMIDDILNEESYISSGWPWLDNALGGGFLKNGKALYIFAGQANIGKSIVLGNVGANVANQNKTVLVITLEMSELLYAQRISSKITTIPMKEFKHETPTLRHSLLENKKKLPKTKILIKEFPPSTITPTQLNAFFKKLHDAGEVLDAIVIDYISLLHGTVGSNSYERIKYVCEQVRASSYMYTCPVISAVQLNRSAFSSDNPGMEGIAESIGVAATADCIISIFQSEEDMELNIIRFGMMKNRYGPRGMVQSMNIDYSTLTVTQSDESEEVMDDGELSLLERLELA